MQRKARHEANHALVQAHNSYQLLLRQGHRFHAAKAANNDILPKELWSDWQAWRKRIREVDRQIERFYK